MLILCIHGLKPKIVTEMNNFAALCYKEVFIIIIWNSYLLTPLFVIISYFTDSLENLLR